MESFKKFIDIVKTLRSPDGCPWDREQTFESLKPHIIEEAYELVDAIEKKSFADLKEELGDVLLHVVMLSNMAEEDDHFSIGEVVDTVAEKMVRRHPHVFGDSKVDSVDQVWENWEKIKKKEQPGGLFATVPNSLPALIHAQKVQKRAARVGFDWESATGPMAKIREELQEVQTQLDIDPDNKDALAGEVGDLLFSVVNLARKLDIEPEGALKSTSRKFMRRIQHMESEAERHQKSLSDYSLEELESMWNSAKSCLDIG